MLHNSTSSSNRSVDMIVSISLSLGLSSNCLSNFFLFMALYTFKLYNTFYHLPFVTPIFMTLTLYLSTDCFVRQCFDTVGWAIVKIVNEMTCLQVGR